MSMGQIYPKVCCLKNLMAYLLKSLLCSYQISKKEEIKDTEKKELIQQIIALQCAVTVTADSSRARAFYQAPCLPTDLLS